MRLRELLNLEGEYLPGAKNQITDVARVKVAQREVYLENPCLRTGLTMIFPSPECWEEQICAGFFSFHGYGEFSGSQWIAESGRLDGPIALTSTSCQGVVRDAMFRYAARKNLDFSYLPVSAETDDSWLSDCSVESLDFSTVYDLLDSPLDVVREGNAGGGMGMVCHEFKGGTGTSSRVIKTGNTQYTLGCLVQANYGERAHLRLDGVPVGRYLDYQKIPSAWNEPRSKSSRSKGSILVVIAVDAPMLPRQLTQLCMRSSLGLGRVGGYGSHESGDLFLAFSTAQNWSKSSSSTLQSVSSVDLDRFFEACVECTEEAIWNALLQAQTLTGLECRKARAVDLSLLRESLKGTHLDRLLKS